MSDEQDNTWTTTQQNRLEEAKRIPENTINDSHGNQKEHDVPVWEDRPDESLPIFEIPIELVSFNFQNVRIEKYKKNACAVNDIDELDETNERHQDIIQNILLNAQDYSQKASGDLAEGKGGLIEVGQREPALLTSTGVLWNGNRRCAIMRNLFDTRPTGNLGRLVRGKIKVCFLPQMNDDELRSLERRLQQDPDYKQSYGEMTEAVKCQMEINNFEFQQDEEHATRDEQEAILLECKSSSFPNWEGVRNAKRRVDLMDDYLESRNELNPTQNLIGYYTLFESTGSATFFASLATLLYNNVIPWYTDNPQHGNANEMFDQWREVMFAGLQDRLQKYDEAKAAGNNNEARKYIKDLYTPVRDMCHTFETASGDATTTDPGDTTHLVLQRMAESKIMEEWDGLTSTEPEEIAKLIVQTREVDGQQVPIGELEHDATKRNQRSYAKVGDEPALQLRTLRDDLASIVQDSLERVGPNDVRITEFIENCRESLTTIEDQNNQTDS